MTEKELNRIETELRRRGYRKYTTSLTSSESWAWFKSFGKEKDDDGYVVNGYQIAFRVWHFTRHLDRGAPPYGFDFWTSALGTDSRMDFTSNWEPICDIDTFERMAEEFHKLVRKYTLSPKTDKNGK